MSLWQDFQTNSGKVIHKWAHYFPIYERHLASFRNKRVTVIEIGVGQGGSLSMWSRFFGPLATVIGVDINPECKRHEAEGIHIRIGSQDDPGFLLSIIDEFGSPDAVVDDGSHLMDHIAASFGCLYPNLTKNGVYIVEDLHTAYWKEYGGGVAAEGSFINFAKRLVDQLNADHSRDAVEPNFFTRNTSGISFYDSVVVIERGGAPYKKDLKVGVE